MLALVKDRFGSYVVCLILGEVLVENALKNILLAHRFDEKSCEKHASKQTMGVS